MPCSAHSCAAAWVSARTPNLDELYTPRRPKALVAGDGAGADDLAAGALFDHLPRGFGVAEEDPASVDGVHLVVFLGGDVEQRFGLGDAGVGDEHVE